MIADLNPYPAYKDPGAPWLGEVPAHWPLRRTKTILRERSDKGFPYEPLLAATQTKGVVRKEEYESRTVLALKDLHLLKLVRVGDFVISLRSFQGGIEHAREQGIISPAYTVLFPAHPENHGFLAWLFKSQPYIENLTLYVTGIRQGQNIDYEKLSRSEIPVPPPDEQAAIVRYLDYVDRRIRRYIRAKQKLIALLNEEKQAIIQQAVTRGLDPSVRLKPSGVAWLGDMPEHWLVTKLGYQFRCTSGSTPSRGSSGYFDGDIPWVRTGELTDSEIHKTQEHITLAAVSAHSMSTLPIDTLLIAMYGQGQTRGRTGLLKIEATVNQACFAILPNYRVAIPEYLQCWFISQYSHLRYISGARNATQPNLNGQLVKDQRVLLPPLHEQICLLEAIRDKIEQIQTATESTQREIALLREYRTRLIADVVTGKLDVCVAAAALPEEGEAPEVLEETPDEAEEGDDPIPEDEEIET